jgi:hypothetical protein
MYNDEGVKPKLIKYLSKDIPDGIVDSATDFININEQLPEVDDEPDKDIMTKLNNFKNNKRLEVEFKKEEEKLGKRDVNHIVKIYVNSELSKH